MMHKTAFSSQFSKFVSATAILALVLAGLPVMSASAASITVNITTDEYLDNTNCSLREAIIAANTNGPFFGCTNTGTGTDDIITLASGSTYTLTRIGTSSTQGDLDVGNPDGTGGNLTIQTSGPTNAIIDATAVSNRVMEVDANGNTDLTLIHITLTGGNSPDGAGLYFAGDGTLTLNNSTVSGNTATGESNCGAGVFNSSLATVVINNSTIESNTCTAAGGDGAGLLKATGGTLTVTNSTFANNTSQDNGGGVRIDIAGGTATITNSTFVNNSAGSRGGGLQVKSGTVTVSFSTFSGNSASYPGPSTGGAVQASGGSVTVLQSILANSLSNSVTGADCDQLDPGTVALTNSLVENNSDCTGTVASSADPMLGSLADNGGATMTLALLAGSPAINLANDVGCPSTDQRGVARPQGAHCDLGSYEFGDVSPVVSSINRASANPTSAATVNFTVTFSEAVTGVDVGDLVLTTTGVTGTSITGISGSGATYTVTVNTGTGSGTIRLDLVDDDSIQDSGGNALGGTGAGNGSFSSGQVYTVDKSLTFAVVSSINRASANPTNASTVDFTVTFSEAVTGVDVGDFVLTTTGITGASITGVSGSGATYTVTVNTGTGDGTIRLDLVDDDSIHDSDSNALGGTGAGNGNFSTGEVYTVDKSPTFADVPFSYWAWSYIERLYNAGVTGGCATNPLMYCPGVTVTRDQMAVFLLKGEHGSSYVPPAVGASTGFNDVPVGYWAAAWIKQLAAEGITAGCGGGNFCPTTAVSRDQMAVFLLKAEHGSSYVPPAATGVFTDVPVGYWAAAWIERLAAEGITAGCGGGNFCPTTPVTRDQMAVFLVKTFSLP
jgi:CSLREA domain-containing protein